MTDIYNQNDLLGVDRPSMTSLLFCKLIHRSSRPPGDLYDLCFLYVTTLVAIVTAAACLCVCALPVCVLTNPPPPHLRLRLSLFTDFVLPIFM